MNRKQAHRPLVKLPHGRPLHEDDPLLDMTLREWAKAIAGGVFLVVLFTMVLFALALVPPP